ncbi:hypothetical protein TCAL_10704 [Tigriopus californicus]|uniref:Major facilitator superfamily (MFS) profile domain-containing protein n=1 Tax=Tigriopus californicus TaxID=6832 RepID=A0A553N7D4_TIGCA|nr:solute carrier family 22 member 15-like [Tigriopus californicus]TRY61313.1 hypothetical protein TCAL_10704 [Tigriopus californicus]|eukprot:TCALIF_10704-PA protein Name:"Similar to Slc22a3 Solute carrier family 22 member 3 (Mus musculus)" AED:0.02 eAED:0.02 QI:0/-1/0/1/-1/1/1/0/561
MCDKCKYKESDSASQYAANRVSVVTQTIGHIGRWQLEKVALLGFIFVPFSWHVMAYPLLSQEKAYWCSQDPFQGEDIDDACQSVTEDFCHDWDFEEGHGITLQEDFDLVCHNAHLLSLRQIIFFLGMLVGCLVTGYFSDTFGRKASMLALIVVWNSVAFFHLFAHDFRILLVLQFLLAFASNSAWTISWVWIMEVVSGKWKIILGCGTFIYWILGYVSIPIIVWLFPNWRDAWMAMFVPTPFLLLYCFVIPESPVWLLSNGREDEAKVILQTAALKNGRSPISEKRWQKLMQDNDLAATDNDRDFEAGDDTSFSSSSSSTSSSTPSGLVSLVKTPNIRKRSLILFAIWFVCSLTYYGLSLNSGSIGGDINITFTFYGLVELPSIFISILSLLTAGRRIPLILFMLGAGLSCIGAASIPSGYFTGNWPSTALGVMGKFCVSSCFHVLFVYSSEIYATPARNTGVSMCSLFARAGGMIAPFVEQLRVLNPFLPVAVFGCCAIIAAFAASFLPETKNKVLPQTIEESESFGDTDTLWNVLSNFNNESCQSFLEHGEGCSSNDTI